MSQIVSPLLTGLVIMFTTNLPYNTATISTTTCALSSPTNPSTSVRNTFGQFTSLRTRTPYEIRSLSTNLIFLHATSTFDLFTLSHWWELVPAKNFSLRNVYQLKNFDPGMQPMYPRITWFVQIRTLPGTPNTFVLHPISCEGSVTNRRKRLISTSFIYSDIINSTNDRHYTNCNPYTESSIFEEKHKYRFVSVRDHLIVRKLHLGESVTGIVDLPNDIKNHFGDTLSRSVTVSPRKAIIKNCASGVVKQDVEITTKTTIGSRLGVENTFATGEESGERMHVGVSVGAGVVGIFKTEMHTSKSWQQDVASGSETYSERNFVKEETISVQHETKIFVGNHSCLQVSAVSSIYEDRPWKVNLTVTFALGPEVIRQDVDATIGHGTDKIAVIENDKSVLGSEEKAKIFLELMKFSGLDYSYNATNGLISYLKPATLQVTSLVSTNTYIQQVKCDCWKG